MIMKDFLKNTEECLDSRLWHTCAGGMVKLPRVGSMVYYFPQGHAEHAVTNVDFSNASVPIPAFVLCHVTSVKFLADKETDEVFSKIRLVPVGASELDYQDVDDEMDVNGGLVDSRERPSSFAKTLTQSDANNGGGFSVPRFCAETIFPPLDYTEDPPLQTIIVKDVHGETWKFRHIYRGTPRRHLLTTGWSTFVNHKKLVAGDSIVFMRMDNGELFVGIRRTKRGIVINTESISGWNPPHNGSCILRSNENGGHRMGGFANVRLTGRLDAESVVEAAILAASGQTFEVVYFPRVSMPEFCVRAASVRAAMRIRWCSGMRFKMPLETEDSSRISWFMGTVSMVHVVDPLMWPDSPWRLLQVTWDEPDLLKDVKQVSPWLVELISSIAPVHLTPFSPPRKKLRIPQQPDFPLFSPVYFSGNHTLGASSSSAGVQGARHLQFGNLSLPNFHINNFQSSLYQTNFHHPNPRISPDNHNDVSCLLTIGSPSESFKKPSDGKAPLFMLFGQPVLSQEQMSASNSGNSSSECSPEPDHCKVLIGSENVERTLDLSVLGSYEELYDRLATMSGIEKSDVMSHVLYRDGHGATKYTGEEPFSEFMKTRRLMVLMDSGGDNIAS